MKKFLENSTKFNELNDIEKRLIELLAEGKTNKEIAVDLNTSIFNVKFYLQKLYTRFNVNNRIQLVITLMKNN